LAGEVALLCRHALNFPNHLNPAHPHLEKREPLSAQILEPRPETAGIFAVRVAVRRLTSPRFPELSPAAWFLRLIRLRGIIQQLLRKSLIFHPPSIILSIPLEELNSGFLLVDFWKLIFGSFFSLLV